MYVMMYCNNNLCIFITRGIKVADDGDDLAEERATLSFVMSCYVYNC